MTSFAQCGQGAYCIEQMDKPVCAPLGCVLQNGRAGSRSPERHLDEELTP